VAELDAVFAQINAGKSIDLPTAVGFCMYIRRACLDAVGLFDAERFGRGYGEENDFSRRATRAGWRNVLCADVFVFHAGGVSFRTSANIDGRFAEAAACTRSTQHWCGSSSPKTPRQGFARR
jgi:GT2 family glycosyltransferase